MYKMSFKYSFLYYTDVCILFKHGVLLQRGTSSLSVLADGRFTGSNALLLPSEDPLVTSVLSL